MQGGLGLRSTHIAQGAAVSARFIIKKRRKATLPTGVLGLWRPLGGENLLDSRVVLSNYQVTRILLARVYIE